MQAWRIFGVSFVIGRLPIKGALAGAQHHADRERLAVELEQMNGESAPPRETGEHGSRESGEAGIRAKRRVLCALPSPGLKGEEFLDRRLVADGPKPDFATLLETADLPGPFLQPLLGQSPFKAARQFTDGHEDSAASLCSSPFSASLL